MKSPRRTLAALALALAVPALLVSFRVAADDSAPPAIPAPPPFDAQPFPDEKTPPPQKAEWAAAPRVTLDPSLPQSGCLAWRVREWVKLRCTSDGFGAIRLLGGKRDGLQTTLLATRNEFEEVAGEAELVIPVRRGDARVIEIMTLDFGYKGSMSVSPWRVISEHWPAEDDRPSFSMR